MTQFIKDTWPPVREGQATQPTVKSQDNPAHRTEAQADADTIKLLHKVDALRAELRQLEPVLGKMVSDYGLRRGYRGYREFYLRNALNEKHYTEANNVR